MDVFMFDMNEFVKLNKLQEVTSPALMERGGLPNPKGLVSNDIFGVTTDDRKTTFAYIDLGGPFFSPHVYKVFKRLYRNIEDIVGGTEFYSINSDGALVKDPNGQTGLQFIYDNWEKIRWERTEGMRNERIDLLTKSKKNEIFVDKFLVIPAFYRDITSSTSGGGGTTRELNSLYARVIRMVSLVKNETMFDFSFHGSIKNIQDTLVEIYDYFKSKLDRKNGLIRRFLLGKSVDYGVRSVIAAPVFHTELPEDNPIDLTYCGMPISQCCTLFYPFVYAWVYDFFQREFVERKFSKSFSVDGKDDLSSIEIEDPESQFDSKFVKKLIDKYIKNPDGRFEKIMIKTSQGNKAVGIHGQILNANGEPLGAINRPMTITDVLFRACSEITANKHVMITRYPALDYFAMFFNRIHVTSTNETIPVDINGTVYRWYPKIDLTIPPKQVGIQFVDTTKFSNSYLAGIVGDYDGDQVTVKGLYSLEANEEAERIMSQKSFVVGMNSSNIRKTDNECVQCLYTLTKKIDNGRTISPSEKEELLGYKVKDLTFTKLVSLFGSIMKGSLDDGRPKKTSKTKPRFDGWDKMTLTKADYPLVDKTIETTVGSYIFNKYVIEGSGVQAATGYVDWTISDSGLKKVESKITNALINDVITKEQFNTYIQRRDTLGQQLHGVICPSFTKTIFNCPPELLKKRDELVKQHRAELEAGDVSASNKIEKELLALAQEKLKDDPGFDLYASEARGSFGNNFKNNHLFKGAVYNNITGSYDIVTSSYMEGFDKKNLPALANVIIAGAYPSAVGTRTAGYLTKQLIAALQTETLAEPGSDCGSKAYIPFTLTEKNAKDFLFRYIVEGDKLVKLTEDNISNYIGKEVKLRSPMTCIGYKKHICNICFGDQGYILGIKNVGLTCATLSSTITQSKLSAKHDGTVKLRQLNPDNLLI